MCAEHVRVVSERLGLRKTNPRKIWVRRVKEPVVFVWRQSRGHDENGSLALAHEFLTDAGEFGGSGRGAPAGREIVWAEVNAREMIGNLGGDEDDIGRSVVGVEVHKVFEHRQRLVLGGVGEASAWAGPAAAIPIRSFAIEGVAREGLAQHAINERQLIPP